MGHKLLIHIGMPKTGTSSLQKFLAFNNCVLEKYGWSYPDSRGNFNNQNMKDSDRYKNDGYWTYVRANLQGEENWKKDFDLFNKRIKNSLNRYHTILSGEDIWLEYGQSYIEYLNQKYSDIMLLVYLRRQDFIMESWYGQKIKEDSRQETALFSEWVMQEMEREKEGNLFYRYYDRLMEFEKIIGRKNIFVRSYTEEKGLHLYKDFLSILRLENKLDEFYIIEQVNRSMSILDIEVKRKWNEMLSNQPTDQPVDIREMLQKEYWNIHKSIKYSAPAVRFNRDERKKVVEWYSVQNKMVSEHYRKGEQLFDNKIDYEPIEWDKCESISQYAKLLEKALIRTCYRKKFPSLSFILDKGKCLALFGAGFMGRRMIKEYEEYRFLTEIVIDNNEKLAGQRIGKAKIVMPKDISNWNKYFVIIAVKESSEIEEQLESFGLKNGVDFMHMDEILSGGCYV